jgi:hypothetical protein
VVVRSIQPGAALKVAHGTFLLAYHSAADLSPGLNLPPLQVPQTGTKLLLSVLGLTYETALAFLREAGITFACMQGCIGTHKILFSILPQVDSSADCPEQHEQQ